MNWMGAFSVFKMKYHGSVFFHAELLILLRETHTDELAGTISKMVENFGDEMSSIAFELTSTLVSKFFRDIW